MTQNNSSSSQRFSSSTRIMLSILGVSIALLSAWGIYYTFLRTTTPISYYQESDRADIVTMLRDDWYWLVADNATDFSADYMLNHHAATFHYPDKSLTIKVYRDEQGKAIGFVTYHKLEHLKGRIQFLAVSRHARKKGIARKLMAHAIDALEKQGLCFIELAVRSNNIPARALYKSFGFSEIWRTEDGFLGFSKRLC
jgi:ribosomal protein S18 acetylase RimI-like enzyme